MQVKDKMSDQELQEFADRCEAAEGIVHQICIEQQRIPYASPSPDTVDEFIRRCAGERVIKALANMNEYLSKALNIDQKVNA